jgi:8-hydroxy-5-deazaflavin:NADPH oxidoreductase
MTDDVVDHGRRSALRIGAVALLAVYAPPRFASAQPATNKLKIGIIGAGHIGSTIGGFWVKAGHPVLFSSRHPEELKALTNGLGPLAEAGTVEDALAFGDTIFLAVPYKAVPQIARDYAPKFIGKVVLDAGNAVAARDGEELLKETRDKGIGNTTAAYFPGARVVRAFNSMSVAYFVKESHRRVEPMAIPIAGDDAHAVAVASQLVRDAGFEPVAVPLARAQEFAQGGPLYGQQLTAGELRQRFGLAQ